MKLTLEHLCAYLPHGLKFKRFGATMVYTMVGVDKNERPILRDDKKFDAHYDPSAKPLLRPLSDLTKPIKHRGEEFVPAKKMLDDAFMPGDVQLLDLIISSGSSEGLRIDVMSYWMVRRLQSWMFDTHGLIESGPAVDVNILEQNPYEK